MKEYQSPTSELVKLDAEDIITTSAGFDSVGTTTTPKEYTDGIWNF